MPRYTSLILAGLALVAPAAATGQNSTVPANVVTPAPAPREGTVGPEQLRDFALPGTRARPQPPADEVTTPPERTAPPPSPDAPRSSPVAEQRREEAVRSPTERPSAGEPPAAGAPVVPTLPPAADAIDPPTGAGAEAGPLPPIVVTQPDVAAGSLLPSWWPWLLVGLLAGIGLALALSHRRKLAAPGHVEETPDYAGLDTGPPAPAPSPDRSPVPPGNSPAPTPTALPSGLVTTRLRAPPAPAPAPATAPPAPVAGGVVSRRLRGWVDLDLVVRELLVDEQEVLIRLDLLVANSGTAPARDIALEAVATNAGEGQGAELARFFARPAASSVGVVELRRLGRTRLSHELRMPRSAIFAYEAQGRTLFVPVIAIAAAYRAGGGEGRTGAAFLIGRDVPGSEKLAPLQLPTGSSRLTGLGVRRLEEAVRR